MSERWQDELEDRSGHPGGWLTGWKLARRAGNPDPIRPDRWIVGRYGQIGFAYDGAVLLIEILCVDPTKRSRRSRIRK